MAPQYFNGPKHMPYSCWSGLKNFFQLNIKFNVCPQTLEYNGQEPKNSVRQQLLYEKLKSHVMS